MTAAVVTAQPDAPSSGRAAVLLCHAASPCGAARSVVATVARPSPGMLRLRYALDGEVGRMQIPGPGASIRADELWRHTCFEAFAMRANTSDYCELNFSPSTAWAAYRFSSYRAGMAVLDIGVPKVAVSRANGSLALEASVSLPAEYHGSALQLALAAVLESDGGALSYWALRHPAPTPDFHHREGFALEI